MMTIATALIRLWTWLYTCPLAGPTRERRRSEVASDTWECVHDPSQRVGAAHLLLRALAGVPDDLVWAAEQLPREVRPPRLSTVINSAVLLVAASGLVATASSASIDPARTLKVNVIDSGWTVLSRTHDEVTVTPAFAFTLTNTGDRATSAVQVNALFSWSGRRPGSLGTAFSPGIGWRGLAPGSTSHSILLCSRGCWGGPGRLRAALDARDRAALSAVTVKLFAHYGRGWIALGEFPIRERLIEP